MGTDRRTTYCRITALCVASRGKKNAYFLQECVSANQGHPRSLIFVRIRKRVCALLLIRHRRWSYILPRFGDIAGFLLRNGPTPIPPDFCGFPSDQIADVKVSSRQNLKQISREIIFEVFQITCVISGPERHRRTDDLAWHNRAPRNSFYRAMHYSAYIARYCHRMQFFFLLQ